MIVQKYLAEQGICSRKEADAFLRAGHIFVNGAPAVPGAPIEPTDTVTLSPEAQRIVDSKETIAVYKPRGVVCSLGDGEGTSVHDAFPQYRHLPVVGRLDKESEGLLLLSNDGLVTKAVTGDTHTVEKEYEVTVRETISQEKLVPMETGLALSDGKTLPATVAVLNNHAFRIILKEGRNRQIRRMCGAIGLTVEQLKRIRIGNIHLADMQPGDSRKITKPETLNLRD